MTDSARRLAVAFLAAVLAIAAVTIASLRSLSARRESSGWVLHTQDARLSLERVLALTTDAESTQRAYLLAGREDYLQPFAAASAALAGEVDTLASLTRDNPRQKQRVESLRRVLDEKAAALRRAIELRRAGDPAAIVNVASGEAGALMQRVRELVAEMSGEESALLAQRLGRLSSAERWSAAVVIGGAALLLVLTFVAAVMVRGDLRRRSEQVEERARVSEYQERLISIVGHDLRNPLTALLVSSQMLLQKREDLKPRQAAAVERIQRSAARIDSLVALLIDFTYARLGKGIPTRPGPMDVKAVVERAALGVRDRYPGREIRVEAPAQTLLGSWDGDRIAQLVDNLVCNALQYGDDAPVTVSLSRAADQSLELRVHNAGRAIPPDVRERLFDPYWRGTGAEVSHPRGLGMGLYIVREIARAHGGSVEVRSDDADGTVFTVRLPARGPVPGGTPDGGNARVEVPVA
jgi:signal transduction histidine kinase